MSLPHSLKEALAGFWQDKSSTIIAIVTISFSLLVLNFFLLLIWNLNQIVKDFKRNFQLQVYLTGSSSDAERSDLEAFLLAQPEVEKVKFVSQAEALQEMEQIFGPDLTRGLEENPLPNSFLVDVRERHRLPSALQNLSDRIGSKSGVEGVEYGKESLDRLDSFFSTAVRVAIFFGGFILIAIVLIVANTIRLLMNVRRETIRLYRLLGATSNLVVLPFIWESLFLGLAGAGLSVIFLWGIYRLFYSQLFPIEFLPEPVIGILIVGVILLSLLGGLLSLRKLVKV
ncbi:MAG: ABC transporter permease [candidate division Zixibacteria bacterium]|nr:ABC transporter permease [candidate division Zixibacteria bacterium]